jgi:hypothetical protein
MDALPAAVDPRAGFYRGGDLGQSNESTEHSAEFPVRRFPFYPAPSNGTNDAELQSSAFFVAPLQSRLSAPEQLTAKVQSVGVVVRFEERFFEGSRRETGFGPSPFHLGK